MKTPMQELIEQMWEIAKYGDSYEVAPCIEAAEAMLEKEKEVMCEFADDYQRNCFQKSADDYYNETFNTKEK
jgi:aspartate/methionine/tyrosine aminotransferase